MEREGRGCKREEGGEERRGGEREERRGGENWVREKGGGEGCRGELRGSVQDYNSQQ